MTGNKEKGRTTGVAEFFHIVLFTGRGGRVVVRPPESGANGIINKGWA